MVHFLKKNYYSITLKIGLIQGEKNKLGYLKFVVL